MCAIEEVRRKEREKAESPSNGKKKQMVEHDTMQLLKEKEETARHAKMDW